MRRRHHYGTTGARLHLDVTARFDGQARIFETDPRLGPAGSFLSERAMMGDIVAVPGDESEITVAAETQSPLLSIDLLRGAEVLETFRPYDQSDLGHRVRICFHGAEYRGRGRQTTWKGQVRFAGARIEKFTKINAWNHDRMLEQTGEDTVEFDLLTTGNFVGFDVWLDTMEGEAAITTNHVSQQIGLSSLGVEPVTLEAGGLDRKVTVTRLPDGLSHRSFSVTQRVALAPEGDTPIWCRIATEDGHLAWSSPIYLFRET